MPSNQGFELTYKNGNNINVPLYPSTTVNQVIGWNIGQIFGPYTLTLNSNNWVNNQQTLQLEGITSKDRVKCIKVLTGSTSEQLQQNQAYSLLDPTFGVESLSNQIKFTCSNSTPSINFQVQISWTR